MRRGSYALRLQELLDAGRWQHSLATSQTAMDLARLHGGNIQQAWLAGLLHDCARNITPKQLLSITERLKLPVDQGQKQIPALLHAPVGAVIARQVFNVQDPAILKAIKLHTLGGTNMTLLDKIIYVADKIEPGRYFDGIDTLRVWAQKDLNQALLGCFNATIKYSCQTNKLIHTTTIQARNSLLLTLN